MARRRVRRYARRARGRFRRPKTIPLAPIGGLAAGVLFGSPYGGWKSPVGYAESGDMKHAATAALGNITGIVIHDDQAPTLNIWGLVNPFDFGTAPGLKGLIWGIVGHKIANYLGQGKVFSGLPGPLKKLRI